MILFHRPWVPFAHLSAAAAALLLALGACAPNSESQSTGQAPDHPLDGASDVSAAALDGAVQHRRDSGTPDDSGSPDDFGPSNDSGGAHDSGLDALVDASGSSDVAADGAGGDTDGSPVCKLCGSGCVDLTKDFYNCGSCDNTCESNQACQSGACVSGFCYSSAECARGYDCNNRPLCGIVPSCSQPYRLCGCSCQLPCDASSCAAGEMCSGGCCVPATCSLGSQCPAGDQCIGTCEAPGHCVLQPR